METFIIAAFCLYAIVIAVLAIRRPGVALGSMLCMFCLKQLLQVHTLFFVHNNKLVNLVAGLTLLFAIAAKALRGRRPLANYPVVGVVTALLFFYAMFSVVWSISPEYTIAGWLLHWPYVFTLVVLSPLVVDDLDDVNDALLATRVVGSIVLLLLLTTANWYGRLIALAAGVNVGFTSRLLDTGNPLAVGSLAGYVVITSLLLNIPKSLPAQAVRWTAVAIGLAACIRSGSRGQLIGMLFSYLVFLMLSRPPKNIRSFLASATAMAFLGVIAIWAFTSFAQEGRWSFEIMNRNWGETRQSMAADLLAYWLKSGPVYWVLGLGNTTAFSIIGIYPHVVPVEVLAEEGLIGFSLLTAIVVLTVRSLLRSRPYLTSPRSRGLFAAVGALVMFEGVLWFTQSSLIGWTFPFAFIIIVGKLERSLVSQAALNLPSEQTYEMDFDAFGQPLMYERRHDDDAATQVGSGPREWDGVSW